MCLHDANHNVSDSMIYHRQLSLLLKHTQPNRWWAFCLELLTTINYNIYIMQTGSKPGTLHSSLLKYTPFLTPYPLEPCPFHSTLHCRSWLWFILIDVRIYMMPTIMCQIARYTIGNYPYCRNIHNQIDGGDFALSSSP